MEKIKLLVQSIVSDKFICLFNAESWGIEVLIMERNGSAFSRIYWCDDNKDSVYLNWLTVVPEFRKQGIATQLQEMREEIGRQLNAQFSYLQAEDGSWMQEWYKRRGYKVCDNENKEENLIWMRKSLK